MSGEPSALAHPPPAPTPRTAPAATTRTPLMPPLSPRGVQKRTPASALADAPVNVTPPRKAAPVISLASRISPAAETAAETKEGEHSPLPRVPSRDTSPAAKAKTEKPSSAAPPSSAAVKASAVKSPRTATATATASVKTIPPAPANTHEAPAATPAHTSSGDLVKELRRLSAGRRSGSGDSTASPPSPAADSAPTPEPTPKPALSTATPTTPRTRGAAAAPAPTTASQRTETVSAAKPATTPVSPRAGAGTKTPRATLPLVAPSSTASAPSTATTGAPGERRTGIQLKLEEASEERRRARIVFEELQHGVQLRKDFRESVLAALAQGTGRSADAARDHFLRREATAHLTPVELDQLLEALGPAPGGTSRGTSRATTPRTTTAGGPARLDSTAATTPTTATAAVVGTPQRTTSPTTPVLGKATPVKTDSAAGQPAKAEVTPRTDKASVTSPTAAAITTPRTTASTATAAPDALAATATPRANTELPPLTPRPGVVTMPSTSATPTTATQASRTPAMTPRERSVASLVATPRARSIMSGGEGVGVDPAELRERERELKALRRDKETAERDLVRANTKLAEVQEKLAQEKEAHSADRKEAASKLTVTVNEMKQTQKDLRDAQRREERLQKELDKALAAAEKSKEQMQALKQKQSLESAGATTPRAASLNVSAADVTATTTTNNGLSGADARAFERKVESLEKDKKRLEEALEKMTQRHADTSTELRTVKQALHELTTASAKELADVRAELKERSRDAEKLERVVRQKTEEVEKLKEKAATTTTAAAATPRSRATSVAVSASPGGAGVHVPADEDSSARFKSLEEEMRKSQRELRQANDRLKSLEAQHSADDEAHRTLVTQAEARAAKAEALSETVASLEKALRQAEKDRDAAHAREKSAEAAHQSLEARVKEAEKTCQSQTKALGEVRQQLAETVKERDALHGLAEDAADEVAKLTARLEVQEKELRDLRTAHVKQREASLVEAEAEVATWKQKYADEQRKIGELEEAVCELQRHTEQVEQEAKTLQTALDAAEQAREEMGNRYASQSKRVLLQQQQLKSKEASSSPARQDSRHPEADCRVAELEASLATAESALREAQKALETKSQEAQRLSEALAQRHHVNKPLSPASEELEGPAATTESLARRARKAESALKAAQRENMEIKAVNDKVFLHLSKLEEQVETTRASSASVGRHSTASSAVATGEAEVLSEHTRELMQKQLAREKASRRHLEQELRRLQAKLRRAEKGEAVSPALSPAVSPNASVILPAAPAAAHEPNHTADPTTPSRRDRHREVPTDELAQRWNRGYFTPLGALSPSKDPSVKAPPVQEDVVVEGTPAAVPTSVSQPRSVSTWRPSLAFEEEEAELQREQQSFDRSHHHAAVQPAPAEASGFLSGPFTSLAQGPPRARRPSRARSPQAAHCLDTRFFDPTLTASAAPQEGPTGSGGAALHLPAVPQSTGMTTPVRQQSQSFALSESAATMAVFGGGGGGGRCVSPSLSCAPVALPARYATRTSPQGLVFASTAQRLLVSGHGRRLERLLLQPTMSGSPSPHKHPDSASIMSTSAVGSMSHSLYAARMDAEGQHWERNVFAFTVRLGDLRVLPTMSGDQSGSRPDPLDILIGFSDRYLPLEGFGNGRNSLRYSGCYYLHVGSGTLYGPAQGVRGAAYPGWAKVAGQAGALRTPPSPSLSAQASSGPKNVYGAPLAAQPGDEITCVLHVRERCIHFEWNGVDCGIAFDSVEVNPSLYPSVEMNCSGGCVEIL